MTREIMTDVLTPRRLLTEADAMEVLGILCSLPSIIPDKWNTYEPINRPFDLSDFGPVLETWGNEFWWKHRWPKAVGGVLSAWGPRIKTGSIYLNTTDAAHADIGALVRLLEECSSKFTAHFGCIHLLTEPDLYIGRLNKTVGLLDPKNQGYSLCVTGYQLEKYIPDLYWVTVFGRPYVKLFGEERLLSAPAHIVREVGGGCIYLQLSDSIYDLENDYEAVDNVRRAVKKHLDCNAFFDPNLPEDHVYNVPELKLEPLPDKDKVTAVARQHLEDVERFAAQRKAKSH